MSVDADELLTWMKSYFEGKQPPEVLANFGDRKPRELLAASLDIVEFVVHVEEKLGREIDMDSLGQSLLNSNFRELSETVVRMLAEEGG